MPTGRLGMGMEIGDQGRGVVFVRAAAGFGSASMADCFLPLTIQQIS